MKKIAMLGILSVLMVTNISSAQNRERGGMSSLESRVTELEYKLERTNRRLERLERDLTDPRPPVYEEKTDVSCLVVDTGFSKTFLGSGRTSLEAEAAARQVCGQSVHSSYCNAPVKCSSGVKEPGIRGYICIVVDSGFSKTFKGEGVNAIEAEAKAKAACQSSVHSSYCGKVTARCDSF